MSPNEPFYLQKWLRSGALCGFKNSRLKLSQGPFKPVPSGTSARRVWLNPPFFLQSSAENWVFEASQDFEMDVTTFEKSIQLKSPFQPPYHWLEPDLTEFQKAFFEAKALMQTGHLEKVVPVVFEICRAEVTPEVLHTWLSQVFQSPTQGFVFGMWDLDEGWGTIGVTPEVLFQRAGSDVRTMALAGTAQAMDHSLLADPKEMSEHQIVIREIERKLKDLGVVSVEPTREWQPSQLRHLRTDISLKLKSVISDIDILKKLHPTPALGGAPQSTAIKLLEKWDQSVNRGSFGAPFGWIELESDSSEVVVAIRSLIWRDGVLKIGSGCGLVQESDWQREWDELSRKRLSVKKTFGVET